MVVECRRWLVAHEAASGVAQEGRIQNWLGRLLIGLPGKHTADDVRMKMAAFVFALNDHRAYCFDDGTLKIAMRRFMFWPSAGELIEFADEMDRWTRQTAARAQKIVDAGARVGAAVDADETDRSIRRHREKQDRERRELAAIVKQRFGEKPPLPQQEAGESASDFLDRLKAWREAPASKVEPAAAEPAAAEVPT